MVGITHIRSILIVDGEGKRICCKYFTEDYATMQQQLQFEKALFLKTHRTNSKSEAEIILFENSVCIYRSTSDVFIYVCGSPEDNELVLGNTLDTLWDALQAASHGHVDKRTLLDNLDIVLMIIDELVDHGIILEADASAVVDRVMMKRGEGGSSSEPTVYNMTMSDAIAAAKDQIARSLLH